jgi:hypothetical protein
MAHIFSYQKFQFWYLYCRGEMEIFGIPIVRTFGIFCGDLWRFVAICGDILWRFGMFVMIWNIWGLLVYFSQFWYIYSAKKKSGNPGIAEKTSVEHKWTNVEISQRRIF